MRRRYHGEPSADALDRAVGMSAAEMGVQHFDAEVGENLTDPYDFREVRKP
jgi:hypothetical protein